MCKDLRSGSRYRCSSQFRQIHQSVVCSPAYPPDLSQLSNLALLLTWLVDCLLWTQIYNANSFRSVLYTYHSLNQLCETCGSHPSLPLRYTDCRFNQSFTAQALPRRSKLRSPHLEKSFFLSVTTIFPTE